MSTPLTISLARSYLVLLLLGVVLVGPSPHVGFALALLIPQVLSLYRPLPPYYDLVIALLIFFLAPMGLAPFIGSIFAPLLVLPGMPLLDSILRALTPSEKVPAFRPGRWSSRTLNTLVLALLGAAIIALIAANLPLLIVAGLLLAALLGRLAHVLFRVPKGLIRAEAARLRVLAGEEGRITLRLEGRAPFPVTIAISTPHPWLQLDQPTQVLSPGEAGALHVTVTPPLAGPTRPVLQVAALDSWGLVWTGQTLTPLEIHVIPRARYAAWLARRYLEQTGSQRGVTVTSSAASRVRGVEYYGLRQYQPGDRLRDIDWRHTAKFWELVVKEHLDALGGGAVLAVNLVAGNPEEADWLAYQLITAALTLARQGAPIALAAYDHQEVIAATAPLHPREALKHALRLSGRLVLLDPQERLLAPPNLLRLRRALRTLRAKDRGRGSMPLAELLQLELHAVESLAGGHVAIQALQRVMRGSPPPAAITVISLWNHDAEALAVETPRLEAQGYTVMDLRAERR